MDYNKYETLKTTNYSSKLYLYTRKAMQVLVLASVFSFLYSDRSFASNFSIKLFACTTERNCIFLLCNAILVLIIRASGLISNIGPVSGVDDHRGEKVRKPEVSQEKIKANVVTRRFVQGNGGDQDMETEEVRNGERSYENEELEDIIKQKGGEEGLDEEYLMSRDELNKKCDEFIKKMKQSIQRA